MCGDCYPRWCARNRMVLTAFRHRFCDRMQIFEKISAGFAVDVDPGKFLLEFDRVGSPLTKLTVGIPWVEIHLR